jgi:RNA polymerase subunit RPABC4/transcription elongation factor Spt4
MTQRSKTNPAMIVLGLLVIFVAIAMFLGVFGISFQRLMWGPFAGEHHWLRIGPVFGLLGLGTLLQIFLAFWVGMDANRRGMNGLLWGLLVLFTFVVGLLVYLIVAQTAANGAKEQATSAVLATVAGAACDQCGETVESRFKVCPFCGTALAGACPGCGKPTETGWKVCPYCSTALTT